MSTPMVNKRFSSEDLDLKADFANEKETKISSIWTSQKSAIILTSGQTT